MKHRRSTSRIVTRMAMFCCAFLWAGVILAAEGDHAEAPSGFFDRLMGDLPFWTIPTFLLFIVAIRKLGWDSFVGGLSNREAEENRLIAEAEQTRREAEEILREHRGRMEAIDEEIRALLDEAHRDAEHTKQEIIDAARHEAESLRRRALNEIARVRDQSLDEIFELLNQRVIAATEEFLSTRLTADDQNQLVEQALAQFETTS